MKPQYCRSTTQDICKAQTETAKITFSKKMCTTDLKHILKVFKEIILNYCALSLVKNNIFLTIFLKYTSRIETKSVDHVFNVTLHVKDTLQMKQASDAIVFLLFKMQKSLVTLI